MNVELITKADLEAFKKDLIEEIKKILQESQYSGNRPWLKSADVRKLLKISPGTLQNLRVNGTLHYTKIGGLLYYKYEDVQKMLNENIR